MARTPALRGAVIIVSLLALSAVWNSPAGGAAPAGSSARRWSGQRAIDHAGSRLAGIAARNHTTSAKLKRELVSDPTLWLDATDHLFYVDPAAPAPSAPEAHPSEFDPGPSTFLLHSDAGAHRVIYLDFQGATLSGTAWNDTYLAGASCTTDPYDTDGSPGTFSAPERETIYNIWQRVSEDYAPFEIDVTTEDPGAAAIDRSGPSDLDYGTRALITKSVSLCPNSLTLYDSICPGNSCGGIAYTGVFDDSSTHAYYQPALIFENGVQTEKSQGEAVSHEVGHTLGLSHDGSTTGPGCPCAYYAGHGSWAPIMGVGYQKPIVQWSKGEYSGANNTEDDLAVMQSHGADLRADDHGDTRLTATPLSGPLLSGSGTITTSSDVDVFAVTVAGGGLSTFNADPAPTSPDLDIRLELRDSSDALIAASDPPSGTQSVDVATGMNASISRVLTAGTYYLWVDGVGTGNVNTGYSDYASLGNYTMSGTLDAPLPSVSVGDIAVLEGKAGKKTTVSFPVTLSAPQATSTKINYSTAPGTASAGSDYASKSGTVTIGAHKTSALVAIKVSGDNAVEGDETFSLNLTSVNTPSVVIGDGAGTATIVDDDTTTPASVSISDAGVWEGNSLTSTATFTVSLSKPTASATPVSYTTTGVSASSGTDFVAASGTVTIGKGKTSATIPVVVNGDTTPEPDETFTVTLTGTGTSGVPINRSVGTGTIRDDDTGPVVGLSIGNAQVVEGDNGTKTMSFLVTLSAPASGTKTILYHTSAGSASAPVDYVAISAGKLKISNGKTSGTIEVTVNGETSVEPDETFTVVIDNAGSIPIATGTGTGTILNDD